MWRLLVLTAVLSADPRADNIEIPVGDGHFLITAQFFTPADDDVNGPVLTFLLRNRTTSAWSKIKLRFDVRTKCSWGVFTWKLFAETGVGWEPTAEARIRYLKRTIDLIGELDESCEVEGIAGRLVFAENDKTRIDGDVDFVADVDDFLQELSASREARERARAIVAEAETKAAALAATKKAAVDAARQKQVAAQRAKVRADQEARADAERRRIRQICATLYENTADKKVKDLTVREEQQVRACQGLGLYPPS